MRYKILVVFLLLFVGCSPCYGDMNQVVPADREGKRVDPGQVHTINNAWVTIDTTSSTGDEPTDLAVTERTHLTVLAAVIAAVGGDDEISVYYVESNWNTLRLRCLGITNNGTATYQVYFGTLGKGGKNSTTIDCELSYAGQLAFTVGLQASTIATYEMADTLVLTADTAWIKAWGSTSPTGDRVAEAAVDLMGADLIVIVPTVASADCKLIGKGF